MLYGHYIIFYFSTKLFIHLFKFLIVPMILGHIARSVVYGECVVRKTIDSKELEKNNVIYGNMLTISSYKFIDEVDDSV